MSYHFIDKKDPRIDVMFQGLEKMERMLSVMEDVPRSLFNGERFLTDEELSKVMKILDDAYKRCREEQRWV